MANPDPEVRSSRMAHNAVSYPTARSDIRINCLVECDTVQSGSALLAFRTKLLH